jgi:hypothetical protein
MSQLSVKTKIICLEKPHFAERRYGLSSRNLNLSSAIKT